MKINTRAILKMADYIETLPEDQLNMSIFGESKTQEPHKGKSCGFVGCVLGHAGHAKIFRDLRTRTEENWVWSIPFQDFVPTEIFNHTVIFKDKEGNEYQDFEAAKQKFGLNKYETYYFFSQLNAGMIPKYMADRMRRYLKDTKDMDEDKRYEYARALCNTYGLHF